jgi:hypothetical protein
MNIRQLLGMDTEDESDTGINISMANVNMPLDLVMQLVLRQQQQLYNMIELNQQQQNVIEHVLTKVGEEQTHLKDYLIQLQNNLENAGKHPVEKEDAVTEQKEHKKDRRPN